MKKNKTYYNLDQLIENDRGWLFYNAAIKNWKKIHSKIIGNNILDLGCGGGVSIALSQVFEPHKKFIGFEGDNKFKKIWDKRGVKVKTGNIYKLPFDNNQFDTVYSSHVLEHLKFPKKAIMESIRVSNKRIIHSVPSGNVNDKNFGSKHLHIYNRVNFKKLFKIKNTSIIDYSVVEDNHMSSFIIVLEKNND